jgi:hypothetical protein
VRQRLELAPQRARTDEIQLDAVELPPACASARRGDHADGDHGRDLDDVDVVSRRSPPLTRAAGGEVVAGARAAYRRLPPPRRDRLRRALGM